MRINFTCRILKALLILQHTNLIYAFVIFWFRLSLRAKGRNTYIINKSDFGLYSIDPFQSHYYGTIKAHKPETLSQCTFGIPSYKISRYIIDIIQSTPNKHQHNEKVNQMKLKVLYDLATIRQ